MKIPARRIGIVLVCAMLALAAPVLISPYSLRVLILALISAIAVVGLCLAFGYTGLIQLGQAAFVGIGAYTSALLTMRLGFDVWLALPAAVILSAAAGMLIGAPMLRLRGHYLALATVGLNVTMEIVTKNWTDLTGGDDGLSGIPGIEIGSFSFSSDRSFYYLALGFLAMVALIGAAIRASHFGRAMIAVRDDELACGACGVRVFRTKLLAFTLASAYGGLSGVLYAHYSNYISPGDFDGVKAITLLVMLIVGGEASILGAIAGAVVISFAPEWLRFLGQGYLTVFGIGVVIVLVLLPSGLAGAARSLGRRLPTGPRRA
jgi:branched-chain amino acid transport system permease protein